MVFGTRHCSSRPLMSMPTSSLPPATRQRCSKGSQPLLLPESGVHARKSNSTTKNGCCFETYFFPRRGYDFRVVKQGFHLVARPHYQTIIAKKEPNEPVDEDVPFLFTFDPLVDIQGILDSIAKSAMALLPHRPLAYKLPQRVCYTIHSNLKSRLIRARITKQLFCAHGSKHCNQAGCPLHAFIDVSKSIVSSKVGVAYDVRFALDCVSPNVIYVITCTKCMKQGVGECVTPLGRLPSYIRTVTVPGLRPDEFTCAIHRHFVLTPHEPGDLRICLVDADRST